MARGYCYCLTDSAEEAKTADFTEESLYEYLGALDVDYVDDEVDSEEATEDLMGWLSRFGFAVGSEDGVAFLAVSEEAKRAYFKVRFEAFKKRAESLSLDEFARAGDALYGLKDTIEENYSDCVCLGDLSCPETMDYFIRSAHPGEKYYVCPNVVFMH